MPWIRFIQMHTLGRMPLVQVRDVPEETVQALKALAAERGQTLSSFLRRELDRLAGRPSNAEIMARLAARDRSGGPTDAEIVAQIRKTRDA